MRNRCKLNPCCADPYDCKPPQQYDGRRWDDDKRCWVLPATTTPAEREDTALSPATEGSEG